MIDKESARKIMPLIDRNVHELFFDAFEDVSVWIRNKEKAANRRGI